MTIEIKHRWNLSILHTSEKSTIAEAVAEAIAARANLAGAYLARANLAGAYLARAYLARADLTDADLARADLTGADLARAYLARADLTGAYLARADLTGAYLADANLADADLAGAKGLPITSEPAKALPNVPVIPRIHSTLLEAVTAQGCRLNMRQWHECETAHCRAGWVVHLAGKPGKDLEAEVGTARAAAMIYRKSDPGCRVPHFYATDERAMADMMKAAEQEKAKSV